MHDKPRFRDAAISDAAPLARLAGELGYPTSTEEMTRRLAMLLSQHHHGILVAELESIVGWIHVSHMVSLESDAFAEIRGLVVAESHRGAGIGAHLVSLAEVWAKGHGCNRIRVRTNVVREKTRKFYGRLGFQSKKTQEVFDKTL